MIYKEIELKEFTSDKPVIFDPPKKMICWNDGDFRRGFSGPIPVQAYIPERRTKVISADGLWHHCAEIPEAPKTRRATNLELAKWLAQGKGMLKTSRGTSIYTSLDGLDEGRLADRCLDETVIRKWDDGEWHEPTVDYMGLETGASFKTQE